MSIETPIPVIPAPAPAEIPLPVESVVSTVDNVTSAPAVQAVEAAVIAQVGPKIPAKTRAVFYEVIKWASLVGSAASATAAYLPHGDVALYVASGGFLLTSIVSQFAKAHIGK